MVVTGNGESGFDSGEGALETATTSKEGSKVGDVPGFDASRSSHDADETRFGRYVSDRQAVLFPSRGWGRRRSL